MSWLIPQKAALVRVQCAVYKAQTPRSWLTGVLQMWQLPTGLQLEMEGRRGWEAEPPGSTEPLTDARNTDYEGTMYSFQY